MGVTCRRAKARRTLVMMLSSADDIGDGCDQREGAVDGECMDSRDGPAGQAAGVKMQAGFRYEFAHGRLQYRMRTVEYRLGMEARRTEK